MLHYESRKPIYFGVKMSQIKVTREKQCRRVFCTLVSSGFFWLVILMFASVSVRFILSGEELMSTIVPDSSGVFRFDVEYHLSVQLVR